MQKRSLRRYLGHVAIAAGLVGGAAFVAPSPAMAATTTRTGPVRNCELTGTVGAFACAGAAVRALADQISLEDTIRKAGYRVTSAQVTSPSAGTRRAVVKGTK